MSDISNMFLGLYLTTLTVGQKINAWRLISKVNYFSPLLHRNCITPACSENMEGERALQCWGRGELFLGGKPSPHIWLHLLTSCFFFFILFFSWCWYFFFFFVVKVHNIIFSILTILKCIVQGHLIHSRCANMSTIEIHFFLPFLKLKLCTNYKIIPYYPSPIP